MNKKPRPAVVSVLLFGSGCAALVYQTVWLRELRLIFGSSTGASAAVTAVFMLGLGIGSLVLGKRVELRRLGVAFYGRIELMIALSALLSLPLLAILERVYFATGGSFALGSVVATVLRIVFTVVTLGVPTFLMGGSLPAAARGIETNTDHHRSLTALLYGANTLGAVTGAFVSTLFLLERFGNRGTLAAAVAVNLAVALYAMSYRESESVEGEPAAARSDEPSVDVVAPAAAPRTFVLIAAAIVGFAFLLMEIVWYRMLAPLLGGSTFTYGLILAVALLGIGLGGLLYSVVPGNRRPTLAGLAATSAFEALALALPIAFGDRIAVFAALLRSLSAMGFTGQVVAWSGVTFLVVFPAAVISGYQFPLLIALLGEGREGVSNDIGRAYLWNTAGAILGSIAGGFGLLPLLTAPGTWRVAAATLALLAVAAAVVRFQERRTLAMLSVATAAAAVCLAYIPIGPTAAWRHSPIGAGRVVLYGQTQNSIRDWERASRFKIAWEAEGRESSVAVSSGSGYAFLVNGKSDGSAVGDAGTQIMAPMVGAMLHPNPTTALVVGLGTGSSAGWLGAVPTMSRVDVVELEPAIVDVAKMCSAANFDVLHNPKVKLSIGDAREFLLTSRNKYSLVFSEPSNPYRAGIASLFTREFYEAARDHLGEDGVFLQWVQTYEVNATTIETIYRTLATVFPNVQSWSTLDRDLLLVASVRPLPFNESSIRQRLMTEPFRSAARKGWGAHDANAFAAHYLSGERLTRALVETSDAPVNTDDRNVVEFGLAKTVGVDQLSGAAELRTAARALNDDLPQQTSGLDVSQLRRVRILNPTLRVPCDAGSPREELSICAARDAFGSRSYGMVANILHSLPPHNPTLEETLMLAWSYAQAGDPRALQLADSIAGVASIESDMVRVHFWTQTRNFAAAVPGAVRVLETLRRDAFVSPLIDDLFFDSLDALIGADTSPADLHTLFAALGPPLSLEMSRSRRLNLRFTTAKKLSPGRCSTEMISALEAFEPDTPWSASFLGVRQACYTMAHHPLAGKAVEEFQEFQSLEPARLTISQPAGR